MTVAIRLLDAEEALATGLRLALEGASVPDAAIEVWRAGLNPDATAAFAISGLIARINRQLGDVRVAATAEDADAAHELVEDHGAPRGRNQPRGVNHAKAFWERALSRPYWTPEGTKPLLHFTQADAKSLLSRAENQLAGWRKVREAMRLADRLMTQRKVDFIRSLPADDKAAIAEALR